MQAGTVWRLRFCRRSWGFKIYFGWNIVRFWKSYICSDKYEIVWGYSTHPVSKVRISQQKMQGNLPLKVQNRMTQRRVLKCSYKNERQSEETRCCRNEPGSEFSRMCKETYRRQFRNHRRWRLGVAEQLPLVSCLRSTSRKSTRIWDSNSIASQKTQWNTSMWICWYGECLWMSLCKPQFILETIIWRIHTLPRISHIERKVG